MSLELPRMGHEVTVCPDGLTAVAAMQRNTYDCLLVDLDMPGLNGIEVIAKAKELAPEADSIVLTGKSSLKTAVAALRHGAFDYLTKPCRLVELEALLRRVAERRELTNKYRAVRRRLERAEGTSKLIGDGPAMQRVDRLIGKVAPADSTVLILGETGTGKELVARALHDRSPRADAPMVPVNCGGLPENLIESELFGHRKGSFTGADEHRTGLFEVASGGTLFLDEIGELPKAVQAKLLRFLESGEIRRVGDNESFRCDVRVVCATHRNLEEMVQQEEFREDLWFRVNTFEIHLPPLRQRPEDIGLLARHLAARFRPEVADREDIFTPAALEALSSHCWPGNVRELANVIEHAMILGERLPIGPDDLPERFATRRLRATVEDDPGGTLRELEVRAIHLALEDHRGNKPKAAQQLGISLKTLYNKLHAAAAMEKA
ncbi:MAG: sigma-54-dependent Fis family transcriptional regulator, partial [Planctomycetes bacterium]|nr:sigma-54-dependent Fis family transcriptional regulator [Planctomycetota bacterium]